MGFNESKPCCDSTRIEKLEARVAELEKKEHFFKLVMGKIIHGCKIAFHNNSDLDAYDEILKAEKNILTITHPAPDADTPPVNWERCEELASKLTTPAPDDTPQAERGKIDYDKDGDVLYVYFDEPEPYYCAEIGDSERFNVMISNETQQPVGLLVWSVKRWLDSFHATPAPTKGWKPEVGDWVVLTGKIIDSKMSAFLDNGRLYQVQITTDKSPSRYNTDWYHPDDLRPARNSEEE